MEKTTKPNELVLKIDVRELSAAQIRLIRSMHTLLTHIATTEDEGEYFDSCSEAIKKFASLVKQSHFPQLKSLSAIPYSDQAIEYSIDMLQECIDAAKILSFDN